MICLYNGLYFIIYFRLYVIFSYKEFYVYFENVRFAHRAKRSAEQISGAEERSAAPQRSAAQEHKKQNLREKQHKTQKQLKAVNNKNTNQTSLA